MNSIPGKNRTRLVKVYLQVSNHPGVLTPFSKGGPYVPLVNVSLDIPIDLAARLATGELYRDGGVVRHAVTKRIVKHLSEVDGEVTAKAAHKLLATAKANPVAAGATAAVAAIGLGAVAATTVLTARKMSTKVIFERFEVALRSYLEETNQGRISSEAIDELDSSWSAAKSLPNGAFDSLQAAPVVGEATQLIADFTLNFAKANNTEISELLAVDAADRDLSDYLGVQRRILDAA